MARILLTASHTPVPRVRRFAALLSRIGHEVTVLEWDRSGKAGELEFSDGVRFVRYVRRSGFGRSAFMGLIGWMRFQFAHVSANEYDMIQPRNLDSLIPVIAALRTSGKRTRVVYDLSDFYGDSHLRIPLISWIAGNVERELVDRVDLLILVSPKQMLQLGRRPRTRVIVMYNSPAEISASPPDFVEEEYDLFYGGSLGYERLPEIIRVVRASIELGIRFGIAGFGEGEAVIRRLSERVRNVDFLGYLRRDELLKKVASSKALVIIYNPRITRNHVVGLPNKFMDAVMLGKPVVVSKNTYLEEIVRGAGIGVAVDPEDERDIVEGIRTLLERINELSDPRRFEKLRERFSWDRSASRYLRTISELIG